MKISLHIALIALILSTSIKESLSNEIYNHGYIGKAQFDIAESRFSLFDNKGNCKYYFNDVHFHPKNFIMQGETLSKIYEDSEKNCVKNILINSLPLIEHWDGVSTETRPTYYTHDKSKFYWNSISDIPTFEEYRKLPDNQKSKFKFLINGFLHFDMSAIESVKTTLDLYPDLPIVGFGEIFGEHDIMSDQMNPPSKIDSKPLEAIYKFAGQKNMVVMIHNNLSNRSFKAPTPTIYRKHTENILKQNRKTKFILPHAGVMRNIVIDNLPQVLDDMLRKNKNLYIDLSFVVLENYIMPKGEVEKDWTALIEKYQDRFLIGTDYLGGYKDFYEIKKFIPLLDSLKNETANKIASQNFESLLIK
jgi:hypothetical protein